MKLYQYDDLKKANQALGSFKRNGIAVINVSSQVVENKVVFFILTESIDSNDKSEAENGKAEKKAKTEKGEAKKRTAGSGKGKAKADAEAGKE